MRPPLPTVKEEKTIEKTWMFTQLSICLYGGLHPSIFERGNGFLFGKKIMSLETKKSSRALFLGFQGSISKEPLKGPEEVEIWRGKVWGIWWMR